VARRVSASDADAEDAVQDAFVSVFKSIGSFDGRSSIGTWLHRIVVNRAITRARKTHSRRETSLDGLLPTFKSGRHAESPEPWKAVTSEGGPSVQVVEAVHSALAALPEEFRAVLVLKDVEGMQSAAIALALGISDSLVRQRIHRGRQAMVKLMTPAMQESDS
jgi:RNA polymerase sigma-70 factor (ECF subfamily)